MSRAYSRVEINELGQVIPIYEDEPVNLIIREIEPVPEPVPEPVLEPVPETEETESNESVESEEDGIIEDITFKPLPSFSIGDEEYHRHPKYPDYGCNFKTGEIVRFKRNENQIASKLSVSFKNGVTLSIGHDENGKRLQKHYAPQRFVAEVGLAFEKLKQKTELYTQVKINTNCKEYAQRPNLKLYPLACLSFEMAGDVKEGVPKNPTGAHLKNRVRTADQIDDYISNIKEKYEEQRKKDKKETDKLKSRVSQLETQLAEHKELIKCLGLEYQREKEINRKLNEENSRFSEAQNTPLKAGALQLQQLLMTRHQGSTFLEMLQFCFKDITRDYPKDEEDDFLSEHTENDENDGNYATFGVFEMSPRGLPYDNEHLTR